MKKVSEVIQSVLEDAIFETVIDPELAYTRIKFVQWLTRKFVNLDTEIDQNTEWKLANGAV